MLNENKIRTMREEFGKLNDLKQENMQLKEEIDTKINN